MTDLCFAPQVPTPKAETKWEAFAREKGIKKTKREKQEWDAETQSWKYTWGRKSAANKEDWLIEHKEGELGDHEDPFIQKKNMKKERIEKNETRRLQNKRRASVAEGVELAGGRNSASLVVGSAAPTGAAISQERLGRAIQLAQRSTRSVGVYDKKREDEPRNKLARKVLPKDSAAEKEQTTKILKKVTRLHEANKEYDGDKMASQQMQEERVVARKRRDAKTEAVESEKRRRKMK